MMVERRPRLISSNRVKDSHGDRVVAYVALDGIRGQPVEHHDISQAHALRLMGELAAAAASVEAAKEREQ